MFNILFCFDKFLSWIESPKTHRNVFADPATGDFRDFSYLEHVLRSNWNSVADFMEAGKQGFLEKIPSTGKNRQTMLTHIKLSSTGCFQEMQAVSLLWCLCFSTLFPDSLCFHLLYMYAYLNYGHDTPLLWCPQAWQDAPSKIIFLFHLPSSSF